MAAKTQYIALNRAARLLTVRLRKLHEEAKAGTKNPQEAARIRAGFDAIRSDIKRAKELNHSRVQALAAHGLTIAGATAREMLKSMSKVELRASLPSLIERANAGDKEALTILGAAVGVISNMPADDRPTTITKLARLVNCRTTMLRQRKFMKPTSSLRPQLECCRALKPVSSPQRKT